MPLRRRIAGVPIPPAAQHPSVLRFHPRGAPCFQPYAPHRHAGLQHRAMRLRLGQQPGCRPECLGRADAVLAKPLRDHLRQLRPGQLKLFRRVVQGARASPKQRLGQRLMRYFRQDGLHMGGQIDAMLREHHQWRRNGRVEKRRGTSAQPHAA